MANYSYGECLRNSYKINWRIEDVLGNQTFDRGDAGFRRACRAPTARPAFPPKTGCASRTSR
jgi:hypothetical protein